MIMILWSTGGSARHLAWSAHAGSLCDKHKERTQININYTTVQRGSSFDNAIHSQDFEPPTRSQDAS